MGANAAGKRGGKGSMAKIQSTYRYPVKGLSPEVLPRV
jgi:hypothetical protein